MLRVLTSCSDMAEAYRLGRGLRGRRGARLTRKCQVRVRSTYLACGAADDDDEACLSTLSSLTAVRLGLAVNEVQFNGITSFNSGEQALNC